MRTMGYLSATDTFRLLEAGLTVYIVSAPPETRALPLDGAWIDGDGTLHTDCSAVVLNPNTAREIGRAFRQQCFLRLTPCADGDFELYLLRDTELNRQVALKYGGGYTADGEHLIVAVNAKQSVFLKDYVDWLTCDMECVPVK